jgi:hypothetical protein
VSAKVYTVTEARREAMREACEAAQHYAATGRVQTGRMLYASDLCRVADRIEGSERRDAFDVLLDRRDDKLQPHNRRVLARVVKDPL